MKLLRERIIKTIEEKNKDFPKFENFGKELPEVFEKTEVWNFEGEELSFNYSHPDPRFSIFRININPKTFIAKIDIEVEDESDILYAWEDPAILFFDDILYFGAKEIKTRWGLDFSTKVHPFMLLYYDNMDFAEDDCPREYNHAVGNFYYLIKEHYKFIATFEPEKLEFEFSICDLNDMQYYSACSKWDWKN